MSDEDNHNGYNQHIKSRKHFVIGGCDEDNIRTLLYKMKMTIKSDLYVMKWSLHRKKIMRSTVLNACRAKKIEYRVL